MTPKQTKRKKLKQGTPAILKSYIKATRSNDSIEIMRTSNELRTYILEKVKNALADLYKYDSKLITERMHEVTVCGRLAIYLQKEFEDFKDYYIDMEYYRLTRPKGSANNKSDRIRCDLLLHSRQSYESRVDNLLAIEVKLRNNKKQIDNDIDRLKDFVVAEDNLTPQDAVHSTLVGLFLLIKQNRCTGQIITPQSVVGGVFYPEEEETSLNNKI